MTVVLGLLAAVSLRHRRLRRRLRVATHSCDHVLLWSYPVGAVLMTRLLPLFPGTLTARVVVFGVLGGAAGESAWCLMYS